MKNLFITLVITLILFTNSSKTAFAQNQAGSSAVLITDATIQADRRASVLKTFLEAQNSPLAQSSTTFIKAADKYNLDWKLVAAISGVESTFGQHVPYDCNNAWGWGIYGDNRICFKSWDEAIDAISHGLRERYIDKWGAKDVYQIGKLYAASPTWAQRVDFFMQKIDTFSIKDPSSLSISL